jgi:hypothetical protein
MSIAGAASNASHATAAFTMGAVTVAGVAANRIQAAGAVSLAGMTISGHGTTGGGQVEIVIGDLERFVVVYLSTVFAVAAEDRRYSIAAEDRAFAIPAEDRTFVV